ncbi:MFS general substrate transporter [Auriculariales sp. MPI-PUGE-AT-0066]|nr:MFS general substrate transporter [Auriculariales sp. MPI-PUGE-AT-0066]
MSNATSRQSQPAELERLIPAVERKETPLPKLQLGILCLERLVEPIAYTQIFPYINRMMEWLEVTDNPSRIGTYSGLVDSAFAFAQLLFIFHWAKLSDRIGRKPVILCGLAGSAVSTLLFGLAGTLPLVLAARVLAGCLAGNAAIIQSMVSEITDETNQARAFSLFSLCWNLGCIIGPLIGGGLSEPATRYPEIFGDIQFFKARPFFLPCAVTSSLAICSNALALFMLKEVPCGRHGHSISNYGTSITPTPTQPEPDTSVKALLSDPTIISVMKPYFIVSINGPAVEVLFVLIAYTAISLGGLARNAKIGFALSFSGFIASLISVFCYPWLTKRVSVKKLYPQLMSFYPTVFLLLPVLNIIARAYSAPGSENEVSKRGQVILWIALAIPLLFIRVAHLSYPTSSILLKHAAPSKDMLGKTFGIGQTVAAVGRGIAPTASSTLFALTSEHHLLGGWLVWIVMAGIGIYGVFLARAAKDGVEQRKQLDETNSSSS